MNLATIVDGKTDLAELFLLIAVIVFVISAVIRVMARATDAALVATGLAFTAAALLVL